MEIPRYLQILWQYKWFLAVGLVVSILVGVTAGYRLENGQPVSRAESSYSSSVTLLLGSQRESLFESEIPGQTVEEGTTTPVRRDLAGTAVVYAYLVTSTQMMDLVEAQVGPLGEGESVTAVRRTTQPGGDERFPGRYDLPILAIFGYSTDAERAEEIANATADAFTGFVVAQQDAAQLDPSTRVSLSVISREEAVQLEGSNPLVPVVVAAFGVFAVFIALVFVLYNWKTTRPRRADRSRATVDESAGPEDRRRTQTRRTRRATQDVATPDAGELAVPEGDDASALELAGVGGDDSGRS